MIDRPFDRRELTLLVTQLLDDEIAEQSLGRLEAMLRSDPAARQLYCRYIDMHDEMRVIAGNDSGRRHGIDPVVVRGRFVVSVSRFTLAAAVLIGAVAVAVYLAIGTTDPPVQPQGTDASRPPIATLIDATGTVVFNDDVANPGEEYRPGTYSLEAGSAELQLTSGASVEISGRTEIVIRDAMRVDVRHGSASFYCPDRAHGFVVGMPGSIEITDLGTRFSVNAEESKTRSIVVTEGEVVITGLEGVARLTAGRGIEIDDNGRLTRLMTSRLGFGFDPGAALPEELEDLAGTYSLRDGVIVNMGQRSYIRTRRADFNRYDFIAEITVTTPPGAAGPNIYFFGIGDGRPDPSEWNNPAPALYIEGPPARVEIDEGVNRDDRPVVEFTDPGAGTHRLRIEKEGDLVTFALDANYDGDRFVADQTDTLAITEVAGFLNESNCRVFFGSESADVPTTFDDLTIQVRTPVDAAPFASEHDDNNAHRSIPERP